MIFFLLQFLVTDSPISAKSLKSDSLGIRQRIRLLAKTLIENQKKWEAAHRRGISLCSTIENIKSHVLRNSQQSHGSLVIDSDDQTLYPAELKPPCEKLRVITTIFEDVRNSAMESKRQLESLIRLGVTNVFSENRIIYKTWACEKWLDVFSDICERYSNEYNLKFKVMENIAHSKSKEEIVLHSCVWEFQTYINDELDRLLKLIVIEGDIELDSK